MTAVRLLYSSADEQGKEHQSSPVPATRRGNCRWPRRNYGARFGVRAGTGAKRRLFGTEAVIAIEIAAAQSRMSSIMGKISIFDPSVQAIFMPNTGMHLNVPEQTNQPEKGSYIALSGEACANVIKTLRTMPSTDSVPRRTV